MDQESIIQALKSTCGNKNLRFQVIVQNSKLHIYINHKTENHPDYSLLTEQVTQAILPLSLDAFKGMWLYSRKLGEIQPNWQIFVKFPLGIESEEMDTIAHSQDIDSSGDSELLNNYLPEAELDTVADDLVDESELTDASDYVFNVNSSSQELEIDTLANHLIDESQPTDSFHPTFDFENFSELNSTGDTDLLKNKGMVHQAPLKEVAINTNTLDQKIIAEKEPINEYPDPFKIVDSSGQNNDTENNLLHNAKINPSLDKSSESSKSSTPTENFNLSQYCFVTNKKILTGDIIPPDKETIRLVKFFHHLSDNNKQKILPVLDDYFKLAKIPNIDQLSVAVQKWFKQITELNNAQRRTVEIWLSRYCYDSKATIEELKTAADKSAAKAAEKKQKRSSTEYSFTPINTEPEAVSGHVYEDDVIADKFQLPPIVRKFILPIAWTFTTIILIILGIYTTNYQVTSEEIPSLCNNRLGSPAYCRLGVNLAGEKAIKQSSLSVLTITEITELEAKRGCQRYANVKAGMTSNFDPKKTPVLSSYGEKIFSHIYVVEAKQKNVKQSGDIRVGCIYTTGRGERSPELLKADVIPQNWPQEHYHSQTKSQANVSFGMYTTLINLGLYTIFTAIGVAIASKLNLGIKINQTQTIYLIAVIVAIVQIIAGVNLLASIVFSVMAIVALSFMIKDFELNHNFGYPLVVGGILIIIATQFLLYGLFQGLMNGLL